MRVTVLACRTKPNTVGKDRFEPVKVGSPDIHVLVDHNSSQVLAHALPHDTSLAMMNFESLSIGNGRNVGGKAQDASFEIFITGKSKIICVACIDDSG